MSWAQSITGTDIHTVQELVECHLKEMILKHFDTKKADAIFADGEVWLFICLVIYYVVAY